MVATLAPVPHELVAVLGVAAALLAALAFVSLGLLLPGLLGWPGGRPGDGLVEPGPGDPSVVSEPLWPPAPGGSAGPRHAPGTSTPDHAA